MHPRLVLPDTLENSQDIDLSQILTFTIGRAESNNLLLSVKGVSRNHCLIKQNETGEFNIEDQESRNGTMVNGSMIRQKHLKHGDQIQVGSVKLLFLTDDAEDNLIFSREIQVIEDESENTESDIHFLVTSSAPSAQTDLNVLAKIGEAIGNSDSSEQVLQELLKIILNFIPAERGAAILFNEDISSPDTVFVLDKRKGGNHQMAVSRRVTQKVLDEKAAVLSNNISQTNFQNVESLLTYGITSVLCVPLLLGEITGLVYLDSSDQLFKFEESHLQQMTAIAAVLAAALKNMGIREALKSENQFLQSKSETTANMIGESPIMQSLFQMMSKVAKSDSNVLISGETGTGKESVALSIHKNSLRAGKPLTIINCTVLTENLIESELFGHEKGAFTGAVGQKKGKVELAEGGTLFLDEIGELSYELQAKLLRFLQEKKFERVGGTKTISADVRIIAATNRNLKEEVEKKRFREDLFYRLNVVEIKTPPLRKRKEDIPLLTQYFIKKYSELCKRRVEGISRKAQKALLDHEWRGNVRELENVIERAIVLGLSEKIQLEDLPSEITEKDDIEQQSNFNYHFQLKEAKRKIILSAVKEANKNYSEAARQLGIHPNNLHRLLRELDIKEIAKS